MGCRGSGVSLGLIDCGCICAHVSGALCRLLLCNIPTDTIWTQLLAGLGLGNWLEANEELEKVTPQMRAHPEVLELRWQIYDRAKKFEAAFEVASGFTELYPDHAQGWNNFSIALYHLGKTKEAFDLLTEKAEVFPKQWDLYYNLACYATQLGRLDIGEKMLHKAMSLGNVQHIRKAAMEDPDLEPLRKSVRLG